MDDAATPVPSAPVSQVTINPPASDSNALAMAAYTISITNSAEMKLHREDCARRDSENREMFREMRDNSTKIADNLQEITTENEKKHIENINRMNEISMSSQIDNNKLAVKIGWIMGVIMTINVGISIAVLFIHK